MENKNILTDKELDNIVETAAEARNASENDMQKIKETVNIDPEASIEQAEKISNGDPADLAAITIDTMPAADVSLFDIEGDKIPESKESVDVPKDFVASMAEDASYDLTDDEVINMLDIISNMKKDPKYPVYKNMPASACAKPTSNENPNYKLSSISVSGYSLTPGFNTDTTTRAIIPSVKPVLYNVKLGRIFPTLSETKGSKRPIPIPTAHASRYL